MTIHNNLAARGLKDSVRFCAAVVTVYVKIGICIGAGILLITSPFWFVRISNDRRLAELALQFEKLQHSPGSASVKRIVKFGNLTGSSNHCDYLIAEVRTLQGTESETRKHYADSAKKVHGLRDRLKLLFPGKYPEESLLLVSMDDLHGWGLRDALGHGNRCLIYYMEVHEPGCDFRCH